eukprot:s2443_g5.t1
MDFGLFASSGPKLSLRRWRTLLRRRLVHVIIVALNFLEGGLSFAGLHLLGRRPNPVQRQIPRRILALVTTCDSPGLLDFPMIPGRSGPEFVARLEQLEHFAKRCNLLDVKTYSAGPTDFEKVSAGRTKKEDAVSAAVQPYTSLNADRLKLVGRGEWDLQEFLDDELWLPYVEPAVLRHGKGFQRELGPQFSREDCNEYLKLAHKWSDLGLLVLVKDVPAEDTFTRIFNCWKNEEFDRQIGDRRLANMAEYPIRGPSQFLPAGYLMTNIHIPAGYVAYGAVTDRKDFYHQSQVSFSRASSNVTPFGFKQDVFEGLPALDVLRAQFSKKGSARDACGDRLGLQPRSILQAEDLVYPAFGSLLQGDHLGVEFALAAHENLLFRAGLFREAARVRGHHPFPAHRNLEGLVIDDYFSVSVSRPCDPETTQAVSNLRTAAVKYDEERVAGSPEKDVVGSRHFKVVGAEIDSSARTLSLGLATVSAPLQKRLAMSVLTLRAARLPIISAALATRLAGNWTSIFMYRRCLASLLQEIYAFGTEDQASNTEVFELPRSTAQELVLASIFSFAAISDVSVQYHDRVFASDASLGMGAVVSRPISEKISKVLWLGGDKKGAYTRLDPPEREIARAVGLAEEEEAEEGVRALQAPSAGLDFSFDFLEVCAGSASVSKALAKRGHIVCAPIELSDSPHYDVRNVKLIEWICNMLRAGKITSLMCEPVCTTFSPAAHPAIRSYKEPKGFDRLCPKTIQGNVVAFRCLFLLWYAALCGRPAIGEQPRLSKMAWLSVWQFLLTAKGFQEAIVASCQFGSIHRKEFRLLIWGIFVEELERRCPGGHEHVRIEGAYTKESAVYVPALAGHSARAIEAALRRRRHVEADVMQVAGIESVVCNDLLLSGSWEVDFSWHWRGPSHINVLESYAYLAVIKKLTLAGGGRRFAALLDSRVAKCSHAKGRSSSRALAPTLRKAAAWQVAGGLYPALGFAPTRFNTADGPSRDSEIGVTDGLCLCDVLPIDFLQKLHSTNLSRVAGAWVRLTLLLLHFPGLVDAEEDRLFAEASFNKGGGPCFFGFSLSFSAWTFPLSAISCLLFASIALGLLCWHGFGFWTFSRKRRSQLLWILACFVFLSHGSAWIFSTPQSRSVTLDFLCLDFPSLWTVSPIIWTWGLTFEVNNVEATSHVSKPLPLALFLSGACAMPMFPANADEQTRAARRSTVVIAADRAVRPQTRGRREVLLEQFDEWLRSKAMTTLAELVDGREIDPERISDLLVEYGKELFYSGKSYGRFSETINGINARRPALKRQLASAWNLAFSWVADEPHFHHPAMPLTIMLSFSTLALLWGWPREAALLMMAWSGLLRIGEVFSAKRKDLVLPKDGAPGCEFALLQINQPKTRGVSAKHQAARIDPCDVVQLLEAVYGNFGLEDFLWNKSPGTFRRRFGILQKALGLPTVRTASTVPYDLASLRTGGATYLLHQFEDAELVRRRGRWLSTRVCEIYLQEAAVITHAARLTEQVKGRVTRLVSTYPEVHRKSIYFLTNAIPPCSWPKLW